MSKLTDALRPDMYGYENDFKESHVKHLKRPALVTIKKPVLLPDEMEDVLTRLLVHYVPPTKYDFNFKGVAPGMFWRAYLVDYHRSTTVDEATALENDANKDAVYEVVSKVYEVNNQENIYLSTSVLSEYGQSRDPINSYQFLDVDKISTYRNICKPNEELKRVGENTQPISGWQKFLFPGITFDTGTTVPQTNTPMSSPWDSKYSLLLLSQHFHEYLQPNDKTGEAQRDYLLSHRNLFSSDGYLRYIETVVVFDPEDPEGKSHFINKEGIKKSFGYVPKSKVYAYKWDFRVPPNVKVNIYRRSDIEDMKKLGITSSFADTQLNQFKSKISVLLQACPNPAGKNYPLTYVNAYKLVQAWLSLSIPTANKEPAEIQRDKIVAGKRMAMSIKDSQAKALDSIIPWMFKYTPTIERGSILPRFGLKKERTIGDQMIAVCNDFLRTISDVFLYMENAVPLLGKKNVSDELFHKEETEARSNAIKKQFTISTAYNKNMTYTDFKVQYYMALLKKLEEKYNSLEYFIKNKVVYFPLQEDYDELIKYSRYPEMLYGGKLAVDSVVTVPDNPFAPVVETNPEANNDTRGTFKFINTAERVFFGPLSGFFITNWCPDMNEVKAPIWNSEADTSNFRAKINGFDLGMDATRTILNAQNKDVSRISIDRVVSGMSRASIILTNANQKYNYARKDIVNRTKFLFEPMDEVVVFLPTMEHTNEFGVPNYTGKLQQVFSGVISKVSDITNRGYHSVYITADCNKKHLNISKTNIKPSYATDERENNMVTPFVVPQKMYGTIEQWMPLMFAQGLSYLYCQPKKTTTTNINEKLVSMHRAPIIEEQTVYVAKTQEHSEVSQENKRIPKYYRTVKMSSHAFNSGNQFFTASVEEISKETFEQNRPEGKTGSTYTVHVSAGVINEYSMREEDVKVNVEYKRKVLTDSLSSRKMTIGRYDQVIFPDPLFNYLWYKTCCNGATSEEITIITSNQEELLKDYVVTEEMGSERKPLYTRGTKSYKDVLKAGNRAAYFIYKTRADGLFYKDDSGNSTAVRDRMLVARIVGTSQATYQLQSETTDLQFSNWKTNSEIINDYTSRFGFLYYTDRDGIVNFTPYNLDLTTLNTCNFTKSTIDTDAMLVTRSSRTLEADDNPQILKQQYITNYLKNEDDSRLVNWVRLTGTWPVGGTATSKMTKALVIDPVLIQRYGFRPAKNVSILGIRDDAALRMYGLSWMDRNNKRFRSAQVDALFDARMDINLPYYVPHDEIIYFCENMRITYDAGRTCVCSLDLTFGQKPLMSVEPFVVSVSQQAEFSGSNKLSSTKKDTNGNTLSTCIENLFVVDGVIKPTTYTQYKRLFTPEEQRREQSNLLSTTVTGPLSSTLNLRTFELNVANRLGNGDWGDTDITRNASICCYNGYLWDNVAGITFEELVYNYAWLYQGHNVAGFLTAVASSNTGYMNSLQNIMVLQQNNLNLTQEAQNAMGIFFRRVPGIESSEYINMFSSQLTRKKDLAVPGIIDINTVGIPWKGEN